MTNFAGLSDTERKEKALRGPQSDSIATPVKAESDQDLVADIAAIRVQLEEMTDGTRALARRRDLVELYTKIKELGEKSRQFRPLSEPGPGKDFDALKAEIVELRGAIQALEGALHITISKSVSDSIHSSVKQVAAEAKVRNGRRNFFYYIMFTISTVVAVLAFGILVVYIN